MTTITRPVGLTVITENIPAVLKAEGRWAVWRYALRDDRWSKLPCGPSGLAAKSNDPATWCGFDDAFAAYRTGNFDGLLFALGDGWAGVDIDDCYAAQDDRYMIAAAQGVEDRIEKDTAYFEKSPGGLGVKVIGRSSRIGGQIDYSVNPPACTRWQGARFFTITGRGEGDPLADLTPIIDEYFPEVAPPVTPNSTREGYALAAEVSDDDLWIAMIANDANGNAILALLRGETTGYATPSEADLALCCHLAFWTNYDADRIDRMFRQSNLYRPKWDRPSYRRATLAKAMR